MIENKCSTVNKQKIHDPMTSCKKNMLNACFALLDFNSILSSLVFVDAISQKVELQNLKN